MTEYEYFPSLITKGLEVDETDGRRIFKGHITAEIIDRQQEFIFVKEVMQIMDTYMSVNPVLSESHTNRMVGKVLDYQKSEINGVASVLITGEVYKKEGVTLYDKVWEKIVKGTYKGLSMGGASKEREPIEVKDRMALELRKLELYEIAICETPANPFAIIEKVNSFAKANHIEQERIQDLDGRCILKCDQIGMCFEKGTNVDEDKDLDNKQEEHGLEQFDKPDKEVEKDHIPSVPEEKEEKAREKKEEVGKQQVPEDPKEKVEKLAHVPALIAGAGAVASAVQTGAKVAETAGKVVEAGSKVAGAVSEGVSNATKMDVHKAIDYFGEDVIRKALEEREIIKYLKDLTRKYD